MSDLCILSAGSLALVLVGFSLLGDLEQNIQRYLREREREREGKSEREREREREREKGERCRSS